jgi:hypothetical protein
MSPWCLRTCGISGIERYMVNMLNALPFALPDWLPPWAALIIAIVAALYALLFLIMPFSVFGVKSRIDALEAQIEALHDEVRMLTMRAAGIIPAPDPREDIPRPVRPAARAELPEFERLKNAQRAAPSPTYPPRRSDAPPLPRGRAEPRLD